jgi:hypothetical protein
VVDARASLQAGRGAGCPQDPDLAAVVDAWSRLPEAIKAGILAMVKAAARS